MRVQNMRDWASETQKREKRAEEAQRSQIKYLEQNSVQDFYAQQQLNNQDLYAQKQAEVISMEIAEKLYEPSFRLIL
jgi:hypothetical protein